MAQTATPVIAAAPMIASHPPASIARPGFEVLPAGACGAGAGSGTPGAGTGNGMLEATSAKGFAWTPLCNPNNCSCPFMRTKDSDVFRFLTVTLPLVTRTPAVVELITATLPDASSPAVNSNGITSTRNG